jgi:GntR family histidine utilization transcriptional repressor
MDQRRRGPARPYERVAASLRERLEAGEWLPGEALPSVRALATEYGVSPPTVSRAVRELAGEGRVTVVPGWGTFAAER